MVLVFIILCAWDSVWGSGGRVEFVLKLGSFFKKMVSKASDHLFVGEKAE